MEPRGEERDDWRTADLARYVIQSQGGGANLTADDLRLKFIPPEPDRPASAAERARRCDELEAKLRKATAKRSV